MSTPEGGFSGRSGLVELALIRAAAGHDGRAAAGGEGDGVFDAVAARERERQAGRKAVAAAVRVDDGARQGRRPKGTPWLHPAAEPAGRRDGDTRRRLELAGPVELALVLAAAHKSI